ncbi:MAG: DinB family protein [Candidatus Acidiferrales bacterium]
MHESLEEYQKRLRSYLGKQDPLKVQAATPKRIERLMNAASPRSLMRRPAPGKWSVGEIVAHLADDELVGAYRIRKILEEPGSAIQAFDQDRWAATGKYSQRDPKKSLELFRALREANLALLATIDKLQWKHHGVHAERGVESIEEITIHFACHDLNHLNQIEGILNKSRRS